jgi:hypothetical protein
MQTTTLDRGDIPMSLIETDNELPPVMDSLVETIKEKGHMELDEFRKLLFGLRITEDDIDKIEKWLIQKGYIQRVIGGKENKQRRDYIVFALIHFENK